MGSIEFESFNATIRDLGQLNRSAEIRRLGLRFEDLGGYIHAQASGDVSAYYNIVEELLAQMTSGEFDVVVVTSGGEERRLAVGPRYVSDNGKDITDMFR